MHVSTRLARSRFPAGACSSPRVRVACGLAVLAVLGPAACGGGASSNPGPAPGECLRDVDCSDEVDCTEDVCGLSVNGVRRCEHIPRTERCGAGSECLVDSALGAGCIERVALWCAGRGEGDPCTPDDACALGGATCHASRCTFLRKECAPVLCLVQRGCNAATGRCEYGPEPDGTACDIDGLACTLDECRDGQCSGVSDTCQCTPTRACPTSADGCLGPPRCVDGTCIQDPVQCPPAEACREFSCDPVRGQCVGAPIREGAACDDRLACTSGDACHAGDCLGTVTECAPGPCRTASCVEPAGCVFGLLPDGISCDDGDKCNGPAACLSGACETLGPPADCDDGDVCTTDACRPADGGCDHVLVPFCCGNRLPEAGEDCDPGPEASPLCSGCRHVAVELTKAGSAPAVAWSGDTASGLVVWEESDPGAPGGMVLKVATVDPDGWISPARVLSGATPGNHGRFHPSLAPLSRGRFALAFYQGLSIAVLLLSADGSLLDDALVPGAFDADDGPGSVVTLGTRDDAILVAWEVRHLQEDFFYDAIRAAWIVVPGSSLLAGDAVPVAGDPARRVRARLGDTCLGDDGALLVFLENSIAGTEVRMSVIGTDGEPRPSVPVETMAYGLSLPPRCAARIDGTYLVSWAVPVVDGTTGGIVAYAAQVDGAGTRSTLPWTLARTVASEGDPVDLVYPVFSSLKRWGSGYGLVTGWVLGPSLDEPSSLLPRIIATTGQPGSAGPPLPVDGSSDGFVRSVDVTPAQDGAILVAWHRQDQMDDQSPPGTVHLRFLGAPGLDAGGSLPGRR